MQEVRHNYNHKSPKKSRKKTTSRPAGPAPDPAPPRRFLTVRKGARTRLKTRSKSIAQTHPKTTPKPTPQNHPRNHPRNHPARPLPKSRQTIASHHPEIRPAFCWVRAGSAPGPDWVQTSFFGNSTTYRHKCTSTATHTNLTEARHNSTFRPSKTPPDPARTQHRPHHETPVFIGCPSCPYSFTIKDL